MDSLLRSRMKAALWSIFIADSLSMPVHWYYNPRDIVNQFGTIRDYCAPSEHHPTSIMAYSSTGGAGRGNQAGDIIGNVILHDKKQYWGKPNVHYHRGMQAGENTLNAICMRLLMRSIAKHKRYDSDLFLNEYIDFMTTKGSHNDTFAEGYHRDFFKSWASGLPPKECAGNEGHDTASIGGFVSLPAIIFLHYSEDREFVKRAVTEHLMLTHKSDTLVRFAHLYTDLLLDFCDGKKGQYSENEIRNTVDRIAMELGLKDIKKFYGFEDVDFIGRVVSSACYISDSFPALLFLLGKYANSLENCLVGNTNAGGENCHRGSALGAVIGLAKGMDGIPSKWINGLVMHDEIEREIEAFLDVVFLKSG